MGWRRLGWGFGPRLVVVAGLTAGCAEDPAVTCDALGVRLSQGEVVTDPEVGLACRCTAEGPVCGPWSAPSERGRLFDPPAPRDGGAGDGGAWDGGARDGGAGDGGLDGGARVPLDGALDPPPADGGPPDGAPPADGGPACPAEPPSGPCGLEAPACSYGPPSPCCTPGPPAAQRCACVAGRWACTDLLADCRQDPVAARCLQREAVCAAWGRIQADRAADAAYQALWDGAVAACEAGDIPDVWRAHALARLNDWRLMAGLPPAARSDHRDALAQACALAMHARGSWTHNLTAADPCFSPAAAQGAAESLVSMGGSPIAVLGAYMLDPGDFNYEGVPHRLWVLSNRLAEVGIGATDGATCMHVAQSNLAARRPFIPWPAPGPFPVDAILDQAVGWTVQSDTINFNRASVEVRRDGAPLEVRPRVLLAQYGAAHGFAFELPQGLRPQAGETYTVTFEGTREPVSYAVELIDCADP